jgi:putative membrane protein
MGFILRLFFTWLAILLASYLLKGIHVTDYVSALVAAAVLALLNSFVKPILVFLTIPITIVTLGLFLLVINAAIVYLVAYFVKGFTVDSIWWAIGFSLLVSFIVSILSGLEKATSRKK